METMDRQNYFGLIVAGEPCCCELHGYEVTLDGRVVVPQMPRPRDETAPRKDVRLTPHCFAAGRRRE